MTELIELLEKHLDDWDFDIFRVEKLAPRGPLVLIGFAVLERHQILENFKIDPEELSRSSIVQFKA